MTAMHQCVLATLTGQKILSISKTLILRSADKWCWRVQQMFTPWLILIVYTTIQCVLIKSISRNFPDGRGVGYEYAKCLKSSILQPFCRSCSKVCTALCALAHVDIDVHVLVVYVRVCKTMPMFAVLDRFRTSFHRGSDSTTQPWKDLDINYHSSITQNKRADSFANGRCHQINQSKNR